MEIFPFHDINTLLIKISVNEKAKSQLQGEEDESSSLHSLSCTQQEYQPFTSYERYLGEESMVQKDI